MIPHRGPSCPPYGDAVDPSKMEYIGPGPGAACAPDHSGSRVAG